MEIRNVKHRYLFLFVIFVATSFLSLCFLPFVNASESITLYPIDTRYVSNLGDAGKYLMVRYEEGFKWISFLAFNLSEIPSGASIDSATLKVKTEFVFKRAWVSVYSSSNADWVETGMSWDTKPEVDEYVTAVWVTTHEEWYTWESSSLGDAVSDAFQETGKLTVMLKSGLLIDQTGDITFHSNAKLEIIYTPETLPPTITDITIQPSSPTPDDEVKVNASVTDNESGVREVNLLYSTDGGINWIKLTMSRDKDSTYSGTIPKQDQGTNVQYYVEAFDSAGNRRESSQYSYTARSEEELKPLELSEIPLWAILIGVFILFGLPIIGVIAIIYFVRKRRNTKDNKQC